MGGTAFNSASYFHQSDLLPSRVRLRERPSKKRPKSRGKFSSSCSCCGYWRRADSSSRQWNVLLSMPYSRKFPEEEPWEYWSAPRGSPQIESSKLWTIDYDEEDTTKEFISRAATLLTIDLMDMAKPRKRPQKGPRVPDGIPIGAHFETSDSDVFSWEDNFSLESDSESESTWEVVE